MYQNKLASEECTTEFEKDVIDAAKNDFDEYFTNLYYFRMHNVISFSSFGEYSLAKIANYFEVIRIQNIKARG